MIFRAPKIANKKSNFEQKVPSDNAFYSYLSEVKVKKYRHMVTGHGYRFTRGSDVQ